MSLRVGLGMLCCAAGACEAATFESLGTVSPTHTGPSAPTADAGDRDTGVAHMQLDVVAANMTDAASNDPVAAVGGAGAVAMPAAAGSSAGSGPGALGGRVDGMPFALVSGYVSGLADEFQQTSVYLFDSKVSCSQLSAFAWLSQLPSTTRVLEVNFPSTAKPGSPVSNASVSFMRGGTYAFSKTRASSSTLTLSNLTQAGDVDGVLSASFAADSVYGTFHADFCAMGVGL